jgi:hypothetical protein
MNDSKQWNWAKFQTSTSVCFALLFGTGCASVTTNLQSVSLTGPLHQPTVHLARTTPDPGVRITPWLNGYTSQKWNGRISGHTMVNSAGVYQIDSTIGSNGTTYYENPSNQFYYKGKNFTWQLPGVSGGIGVDLDLIRSLSVILGLGMSTFNADDYWSAQAGVGYSFGNERFAGRIEGVFTWETIGAMAQYVRRTHYYSSDKTEVEFFSVEDTRMRSGNYIAMTFQSTDTDLAFYLQGAFGSQQVASLLRSTSSSSSEDEYIKKFGFVSLTPGVAIRVGENRRLIAGIRFTSNTEIEEADNTFLIVPTVQFELSF